MRAQVNGGVGIKLSNLVDYITLFDQGGNCLFYGDVSTYNRIKIGAFEKGIFKGVLNLKVGDIEIIEF